MFEKYIMIRDSKVLFGQNATSGAWYCKELPANDLKEMDQLMTEANVILNKHNAEKKIKEAKEVKEHRPKF